MKANGLLASAFGILVSGDDEFSGPGNVLLALLPIQSALRITTLIVAGYRRRPGI